MSPTDLALWLDQTPPSVALKDSALLIPLIQSVHILAVALVVSSVVLLTLRAWDLGGRGWPLERWSTPLLARVGWAVGLLAVTGALLILAEPTRELPNRAFQAKIILLLPTLALVFWLRSRLGGRRGAPATARLGTAAFLGLAIALVGLGRWIAYA